MNENPTPESVNGLVKQVFGSRFSGDFERKIFILKSEYPYTRSIDGKLGIITEDTSQGGHARAIGGFENQDGSHLIIYGTLFGSTERKAKNFARLYYQRFGKKVTLERIPLIGRNIAPMNKEEFYETTYGPGFEPKSE